MLKPHPHNKPHLKQRRKDLRNNLTSAETTLWKHMQNSQLGGKKFRRQHSIGPYILDFYCPAKQLAIELDGESHNTEEQYIYDEKRTQFLHRQGVRVIRFENKDVLRNLDGVLLEIKKYL